MNLITLSFLLVETINFFLGFFMPNVSVSSCGFFACLLSATPIDLHLYVFLLTEIPFLSRLSSQSLFFVTKPKLKNTVQ